MERVLNQLVERLTKTYGDRLVSVVLYGSAAVGDHHGRYSDLNVLCVLREVTPRELGDSAPIFRWWRKLGNPSPLLLSLDELRTSTDCFPIEFHDIKERHRVLRRRGRRQGPRGGRLLLPRPGGARTAREAPQAAPEGRRVFSPRRTCCWNSWPTRCRPSVSCSVTLCCSTAWKRSEKSSIIDQAAEKFGIEPSPFRSLLDLREQKIKAREIQPGPLFERYLKEIQVVVDAVDRLEK